MSDLAWLLRFLARSGGRLVLSRDGHRYRTMYGWAWAAAWHSPDGIEGGTAKAGGPTPLRALRGLSTVLQSLEVSRG